MPVKPEDFGAVAVSGVKPEDFGAVAVSGSESAAPPSMSLPDQVKRSLGLAGRATIKGVAALPTLMAEAVYQPTKALFDYNNPGNTVTSQNPSPSASLDRLLTRVGLPAPETSGERITSNVMSGMTGIGSQLGLLGALRPATATGEGIRQAMMQAPTKQLVGAGTGAASATTAGELGFGPIGQAVAGVAGSMVPFVPGMFRGQPTPETIQTNQSLKRGMESGYVVPPSQSNPSLVNKTLGGYSGQAATEQAASIKNQPVTNALAKRAIGVPEDAALSVGKLEQVRNEASAPYREIAAISPSAKNLLEDLKQARFNANENYQFYQRTGNPEIRVKAEGFSSEANRIENLFERYATSINRPDLMEALRAARQRIAKTYDVERALNVSTGDVDARVIGHLYDKDPGKFTGPLKNIGEFANTARMAVQDRTGRTPPFISPLDVGAGGIMATGAGNYGWLGVMLGRPIARAAILSKPYQSIMAQPNLSNLSAADSASLGLLSGMYGRNQ